MRPPISTCLCVAALSVPLFACEDDPLGPASPVAIAVVSGRDQVGKAGKLLSEPFVVRLTDARGGAIEGGVVVWRVASGAGDFGGPPGNRSHVVVRTTDGDGVASALFRPTALGASTVVVEAAGGRGPSATFATEATVMVIRIGYLFDCLDPSMFIGPDDTGDEVRVPVGTPVEWVGAEWVNPECGSRIASTSTPSGGESFDSGGFAFSERFQFVPSVAGTWTYADLHNGGSGAFTAW